MSHNAMNFASITGRLAADPVSFVNKNGSKTVRLAVYAENNYKTAGKVESEVIPVEAYVLEKTQGLGPFDLVHKGDLVQLELSLKQVSYPKNGTKVYELKAQIQNIHFLENRATTQARLAARVAAAAKENTATQAEAPAAEAEPAFVAADEAPFGR